MILFKAWPTNLQNVHGWWMRNISTVGHRCTQMSCFPHCALSFLFSLSLNYYGKTELKPLETLTLSIKLGACVCMRIQSCMVKCLCVATFVWRGQCFQVNVQCMPFLGTLMGLALMARLAYHAEVVAVRACVCLFVCVCLFSVWVGGSVVWGARMKELPLWLSHELCGLLMGADTRICAHSHLASHINTPQQLTANISIHSHITQILHKVNSQHCM